MTTRSEVVEELRSLFKKGSTPSRLIRHIAVRHGDEPHLHSVIQDYFMEAFGVPIVRGLKPLDNYDDADLRYAFLNEQLLHDMIARRAEWDANAAADRSGNGRQRWFEGLAAAPDEDRIEQLARSPIVPELAECWARLSQDEQSFIRMIMASVNHSCETVKILARLAETLQQRVNELESAPSLTD